MYYAENIIDELSQNTQIAIFGAGVMALDLAGCLLEKPYQLKIECCLVSDLSKNPADVNGIPVMDFHMAEKILRKDAAILVAAVEKNLDSMLKSLHRNGYSHLIPLTYEGDLWSLIRGNYYREFRLAQHKPYLTLEEELHFLPDHINVDKKRVSVYSTRCHVDRKLQEDITKYSWEIPIQAGAALTDERICEICDNTGDNISYKNRQYCELTALYWIWKNSKSDYVGLGHYRRHFELTEKHLAMLADSDIDVVLTIPILDHPNVGMVYKRDHVWEDWEIMQEAIQKISPDYIGTLSEMQEGKFYYAYNMFIMRRRILDDYCTWLFPLLLYCEEHCKEKKDCYQNRYIGFLAEHLMSAYFMHHENEYKIVHAKKHFIEK